MEKNNHLITNNVKSTIFGNVLRNRSFIIRLIIVLGLILLFCRMFEIQIKKEILMWNPALFYGNVSCEQCPKAVECPKPEKQNCGTAVCAPSACPAAVQMKVFKYEEFECFQFTKQTKTQITLLEDVMDAVRKPRPDSIFFLETSCKKNGLINLSPRQMCSIESAAFTNPNRDIFVLFVTPVGYAVNSSLDSQFIPIFSNYSNIFLRNMNLPKYVNDTPVQDWFNTGKLFESKHLHVHTSDFLRLLTVYKWGGTYFDLDFVVLRNLDELEPNFFCTELENGRSGNSVVNFRESGHGHDYAARFLQEFTWRFDPTCWSANGPELFRRMAEQTCETKDHKNFTRQTCGAFEVHPYYFFYPLNGWTEWDRMYKSNWTDWVLEKSKNSFGVHTWNTRAKSMGWAKNEPNSVYSYWMKNYCPKMYAITGSNLFGTF